MPSGLGRGLGALIPKKPVSENPKPVETDVQAPAALDAAIADGKALEVDVNLVDPNPYQPRSTFVDEELQDLAESVRIHGVLEPLVVTKKGDRYELIAGERRLRASKLAGLKKVPVVVRDWIDDRMKLELAIIENVQRADLNAIEEALAYKQLVDEFSLTQEEVGKRVGKSRPTVANSLRLLKLPLEIQTSLREGRVSSGQVRALLALETADEQLHLFKRILETEMSSRETEQAVTETRVTTTRRDPNLMAYEADLRGALGTKVRITEKNGRGKIIIEYFSREDLMGVKHKITGKGENETNA